MQGVRYSAYILTPYLDLGSYYIQQNRLNEAKEVLLAGVKLEEFALVHSQNATIQVEEEIALEAAKLHLSLAYIFNEDQEYDMEKLHLNKIKEMSNVYPIINSYLNK